MSIWTGYSAWQRRRRRALRVRRRPWRPRTASGWQSRATRPFTFTIRTCSTHLRPGGAQCFSFLLSRTRVCRSARTHSILGADIRKYLRKNDIVTIAGITAFSAAAALTHFPVGTGKLPATIVPTSDDLLELRAILQRKGTKVLMKIGRRLDAILEVLEAAGMLDRSLLVSRVGMDDQRIETDLRALRGRDSDVGYLSIILVPAAEEEMDS